VNTKTGVKKSVIRRNVEAVLTIGVAADVIQRGEEDWIGENGGEGRKVPDGREGMTGW
jgi:hypothetical protein